MLQARGAALEAACLAEGVSPHVQQQDRRFATADQEGVGSPAPRPGPLTKAKRLPPLPRTVKPPGQAHQAAEQHQGSSSCDASSSAMLVQSQRQQQRQGSSGCPTYSTSKTGATRGRSQGSVQVGKGCGSLAKAAEPPASSAAAHLHKDVQAAQSKAGVRRVKPGRGDHQAADQDRGDKSLPNPVQSRGGGTGRVKSNNANHQAATSCSEQRQLASKGRAKTSASTASCTQDVVTTQPGKAKPICIKVTRTVSDNSESSEDSEAGEEAVEGMLWEGSKAAASSKLRSAGGAKQPKEEAKAAKAAANSAEAAQGGNDRGQQQVARLTSSNTALLSELVDLQVRG